MSKALKITFIVIASILVLLALGLGLGLGLRQNEQPETEVLTLNVDGDNVKRIQLEPGDNVYSYITENYPEYTDYNTCGWFIEDTLTMPLTEDITIAEDENITIYTRTATLDKLSFTLNDDNTTFSVSASRADISGEVVVPKMYTDQSSSTSGLVTEVAENGFYKDTDTDSAFLNNITLAVLPSSIHTINANAFRNNYSLKFINIPYGVTTIGDRAYMTSQNSCVTSITIPETIETFGYGCFATVSLAEVYNYSSAIIALGSQDNGGAGYYAKVVYNASDLVNGKPESRVKTIGNVSYYVYEDDFIALAPTVSRATLTEVVLDERTTEINQFAFTRCQVLESINIPENVQVIGRCAFQNCNSLSSPIVIPEGITEIEDYTFFSCYNIPSVIIPSTVTNIDNYAFYNCQSLTNVTLNDGLQSIGEDVFHGCESISSINIPGSVQTIGEGAFFFCFSLMNVTLNDGLESIGSTAFAGYNSLKSVTIPQTVTTIGDSAFSASVVEVYNYSDLVIEQGSTDNGGLGQSAKVIYNAEDLQEGKPESKIQVIGDVQYYVDGDDFIAVGTATSEDRPRSEITNIVLDERTTEIYRDAFNYHTTLETIVIPEGVTTIGPAAFSNCDVLTSVEIPSTVTSVGGGAFSYDYILEDVTINSVYAYATATSETACGNLLNHATTVRVLASIVDSPENTNTWLNGLAWNKSESADDDGYYTYTRTLQN